MQTQKHSNNEDNIPLPDPVKVGSEKYNIANSLRKDFKTNTLNIFKDLKEGMNKYQLQILVGFLDYIHGNSRIITV